jgi:vitamin B12 transporter
VGSYGTHVERLSGGAASGDFRFLMSGEHVASHGFSRVGDRDSDEADGLDKWSGSFTGTWAPAGGPTVEVGVRGNRVISDYDGAPPSLTTSCYQQKLDFAANAPNIVDKGLVSGYGRVSWSSHDGGYQQSVTGFATVEGRDNDEFSATFDGGCVLASTSERNSQFRSHVAGVEYQGIADAGALGTVLVGGRDEREHATYTDTGSGFNAFDSDRTLYALFVQDQVTIAERLNLSFTGRYDGQIDGEGFLTGRATAAYGIPATGTKLRASAGTAAKRPTAYMIGYNMFSDPTLPALQPERSFGFDAGIDQSLFDGRLIVSATGFYNRFSDLLTFTFSPSPGHYENVANASTAGVELSGSLDIVPGTWWATTSYTYLVARDLDNDTALPRRPEHSGAVALNYANASGFEASLSAVLVGARFNKSGEVEPLPAFARLDLAASYPLSPATKVFGRIENLTNAQYQDPGGYNTPGLSAYVGLTWKN